MNKPKLKKSLYTLLLLTGLVSLTACNKTPAAGFTTEKDLYAIGEAIQFTNTSVDAKSYKWDFGNGYVSNEKEPSYTYPQGGNYTVTLTAYSKKQKAEDTYSKAIQVADVWNGPSISFTKADSADWTLAENQDQITPTCAITRANTQGIFNIAVESSFTYYGPTNTRWAYGTTANIENLVFNPLMVVNGEVPPSMLNKAMVLYIEDSGTYIDLTFTSWTQGGQGGGFSYTRSTQ